MTYVDSSVLVAVYVPERFSKAARQAVRAAPEIPFTQLHELEVRNAFELLVGRNLITREECRAIQAQLDDNLESQRLAQVRLSRTYTARISLGAWICCTWRPLRRSCVRRLCRPTTVSLQPRKPPASKSWLIKNRARREKPVHGEGGSNPA
jgi:hypothetical protein